MAATILILVLIAIYSVYVIMNKKKQIKEGKFCSCGCQDCPSKIKCGKRDE